MPTPVDTARQCLTQEGVTALDEAVAVAKRRGHSQTTSLHMVSSLLSFPNSILREACAHARSSYSSRAQFKALELSLSVSLDRLPSSSAKAEEEPPVSNSLMAAVKRSQANQRRQPENFSFYQQQEKYYGSSTVSAPVVKVELRNLILSILDDPLVGRVLGEAGFRSYDVKMALVRPNFGGFRGTGNVFGARYMRSLNSRPMFLCNFGENTKGFNFPFMGCFMTGDDHQISKRVAEVMVRDKKRNPLLLGVGAVDVLTSFLERAKRPDGKGLVFLPEKLSTVVISVKDEILKLVSEDFDEGSSSLKFKLGEVDRAAGDSHGVVVNLGDLEILEGVSLDGLRLFVSSLSSSLKAHRGKLWLIGAVTTYEVYYKVLGKVSTLEDDWDLETLPITSLGGSFPRSKKYRSLMESFVPLGGFFSLPSEIKIPSINARISRCHLCNEKYEQELASLRKRGLPSSLAEQYHSTLPCWLQNVETSPSSSTKGKDDDSRLLLINSKIADLQKKWDDICQEHHYNQTYAPRIITGFQPSEGKDENSPGNGLKSPSNEQGNKNLDSSLSTDIRRSSTVKDDRSFTPSELQCKPSDDLKSQASVTSATSYRSMDDAKQLYRALVGKVGDLHREYISTFVQAIVRCQGKENACEVPRYGLWMNMKGPDKFIKIKLGLALAESLLHESAESFVYVDLNLQDETQCANALFNSLRFTNKYRASMRVTVVEYLVEILSKRPCVVFLENIDKADIVVQSSLSRAMETGKLTDLRGREANICNSIFLGSQRCKQEGSRRYSNEELMGSYCEEDVLTAKGSSIKILIRYDLSDGDSSDVLRLSDGKGRGILDSNHYNKRKLTGRSRSAGNEGIEVSKKANKSASLDLNFPAEEEPEEVINMQSPSSDLSSEDLSRSWMDRRAVAFEPFDYDALAEKLYEEACNCLHDEVLGFKCLLEIERKVMQQFLAAAFVHGDEEIVVKWIRSVLRNGFVRVTGKFSLDSRSIVKLVTCDDKRLLPYEEGEEEGMLFLPPRIIVN